MVSLNTSKIICTTSAVAIIISHLTTEFIFKILLRKGKNGVQNGYNATKLFLFNGKESITKPEFKDVDDFRQMSSSKFISSCLLTVL